MNRMFSDCDQGRKRTPMSTDRQSRHVQHPQVKLPAATRPWPGSFRSDGAPRGTARSILTDWEFAPRAWIRGRSALPEWIPDLLRACWQWRDRVRSRPSRTPLSRTLPWIAPAPDRFDIGSPYNSSPGRRQRSLVPLLRIAAEEYGSGRRLRKRLEPAAWRHKRRLLPGESRPRIAGGAPESAALVVHRERHRLAPRGCATAASPGGRRCNL